MNIHANCSLCIKVSVTYVSLIKYCNLVMNSSRSTLSNNVLIYEIPTGLNPEPSPLQNQVAKFAAKPG